jgi:alpha-amylase
MKHDNNRAPSIKSTAVVFIALITMIAGTHRAQAGDVILQCFESQWETIERRMPDIFMAGYSALWVPPPGLADSGGFSVGYDVFDRFNLGTPFRRTLYGTTEGFDRLSDEMDQAGIALYIDTVLNHNGFRDASSIANDGFTPFEESGGYPGFVTRLDGTVPPNFYNDVDGDFHGRFEGGDLNFRLSGLIDIAQEKAYFFYRHPAFEDENNIPNEEVNPENRRFYPDLDLPFQEGRAVYNLADPLAGDPVIENATALLVRYLQYMVEVHGVDGFRLDAVKHTPTFFFNDFFDARVFNVARNPITGTPQTPFSFGEALDGSFSLLDAYTRKDGFGNRDVLDFPLFFTMRGVFDGGGFGDMTQLEFGSFDGSDGNANDGSRGVMFANSHDDGNIGLLNLAMAHILTRTGFPVVYYNAKEFGEGREFPKDGRGDALGNFGSDLITHLVRLNKVYASESHLTRYKDPDLYIYERNRLMIIGLNDRGDAGFDERTIQTSFQQGTVLKELSGNAESAFVDPNDDIFDTVTVGANGVATIRVPRNSSQPSGGDAQFTERGFVIYGPEAPRSTLTITNAAGEIGSDSPDIEPESRQRLTTLTLVTADTIDVELAVDPSGPVEDNALIKLNYGLPIDANNDNDTGVFLELGRFAGFEQFTDLTSPTASGGSGMYALSIDATVLDDGYQYIETAAFLQRNPDEPPIYDNERVVVYLDREDPGFELKFPTQSGTDDITTTDFEVVVAVDRTVDNVHVFTNLPDGLTDQQVVDMADGDSQADRRDRLEWRKTLSSLLDGTLKITVLAFEPTGRFRVEHFGGIDVNITQPETFIGWDNDGGNEGTTQFDPIPPSSNDPDFDQDFVVRVDTDEGALSFTNGDFVVEFMVDDGPWLPAQPFDPSRPENTFFQNDQDFGDSFDEFRYIWRGYSKGPHTLRARARLSTATIFNEVIANIFVEDITPGPAVTITNPAPPSNPPTDIVEVVDPVELLVEGTFDGLARFAQVFIDFSENPLLLEQFDAASPPEAGPFSVSTPVASFSRQDVVPDNAVAIEEGTFPVRVIANTGNAGTGIQSEVSSQLRITGLGSAPQIATFAVDNDADSDLLGEQSVVLVISPADADLGPFPDFGANNTVTELRGRIANRNLYVAIRGEFFARDDSNPENVTLFLLDINNGSGQGVRSLATELTDTQDGLRTEISGADFAIDAGLPNAAFDVVVGITDPNILVGYTFASSDLPAPVQGANDDFQFQSTIVSSFDSNTSEPAAAPGTTIVGTDTVEIAIPLDLLGSPDVANLAMAVATTNDSGTFTSPNTLPENSNDTGGVQQVFQSLATFNVGSGVLINEVGVGAPDQIELFNTTGSSIDLTGWTLSMSDPATERRDLVFPNGTMLDANGYLVVSDDGMSSPPAPQTGFVYTGFNIPWDPSRGGAVWLEDANGVALDYVDWLNSDGQETSGVVRTLPYNTGFAGDPAPTGPTAFQSLGRSATSGDTDAVADWENTGGVDAEVPSFGGPNNAASNITDFIVAQ